MAERACRVIRFPGAVRRRVSPERPARTIGTCVAEAILQRWGFPVTDANLDAIESACQVPIGQLQTLAATLPRWICSDAGVQVGSRIREVQA